MSTRARPLFINPPPPPPHSLSLSLSLSLTATTVLCSPIKWRFSLLTSCAWPDWRSLRQWRHSLPQRTTPSPSSFVSTGWTPDWSGRETTSSTVRTFRAATAATTSPTPTATIPPPRTPTTRASTWRGGQTTTTMTCQRRRVWRSWRGWRWTPRCWTCSGSRIFTSSTTRRPPFMTSPWPTACCTCTETAPSGPAPGQYLTQSVPWSEGERQRNCSLKALWKVQQRVA